MNRLSQSVRIKLNAYAEKRGKNKLEALNEALDRALSVSRADIGLKTAYLVLDNFTQDIKRKEFLNKYKR